MISKGLRSNLLYSDLDDIFQNMVYELNIQYQLESPGLIAVITFS